MGRGEGVDDLDVVRSALSDALVDSEAIAYRREAAAIKAETAALWQTKRLQPSFLIHRALQTGEHPDEINAYLEAAAKSALHHSSFKSWSRTLFKGCGYQTAESPYLIDSGSVIHIRCNEKATKAICGFEIDFEEIEVGYAIRPRGSFAQPEKDYNRACRNCRNALSRFGPNSPLRQAATEKRSFDPLTAIEHEQITASAQALLRQALLDGDLIGKPEEIEQRVFTDACSHLYPIVARNLRSLSPRPRARAVFNFGFSQKGRFGLRLGMAVRAAYGEDGEISWPGEQRLAAILKEAFEGGKRGAGQNDDSRALRFAALLVAEQWPKAIPHFFDKKRENQSQELIDLWATHPKTLKIVADYFNRPRLGTASHQAA